MTTSQGEIKYLVLTDGEQPFLLARVRWPDVYQAVSAVRPQWENHRGVFDFPYVPAIKSVSFSEAAQVAASWGVHLPRDENRVAGAHRIERLSSDWSPPAPVRQVPAPTESDASSPAARSTDRALSEPRRWRRGARALLGVLSGAHFLELDSPEPGGPAHRS